MSEEIPKPQLFEDWLSHWWQAFLPYPFMAHTRFFRTRGEAIAAFYRQEVTYPDGRGPAINADLWAKAFEPPVWKPTKDASVRKSHR